jgi:predicted transcriptional regulator
MQKLPESELDVMLALWEAENPPVPRAFFDAKLVHKGWTVNALNSFLSRLEDRGFLASVRDGKNKLYTAIVSRDAYVAQEGKGILEKLYRGSLKNFILSVTEQDGMDNAEIDELQRYLNELKGEQAK